MSESYPLRTIDDIEICSADGDFDKAYSELRRRRFELVDAAQLAQMRIAFDSTPKLKSEDKQLERWKFFIRDESYVAENYNYFPDGYVIIASRALNPILKNPKKATDANRSEKEYEIPSEDAKELLRRSEKDPKKAIKSGALFVPKKEVNKRINIRNFDKNPVALFLFREHVAEYAQLLKKSEMGYLPQLLATEKPRFSCYAPVARGLRIYGLWDLIGEGIRGALASQGKLFDEGDIISRMKGFRRVSSYSTLQKRTK
ncbi:hypothetical protein ACFLZ7_00150 [Nanoarchaeota archaeon]